MGKYLTNGSLNRIFTRVKGYVDKLKTSGQVYDSARWGGKLLSEAVMRYSYAINTKGLDKTKFYPVVFGASPWTFDCEIHTPGAGGSAEFNQNYIHFMCNSYGWNDLFDNFKILTNGNYDDNEIVIGAIGAATENGQMCVWVRGGIEYDIVFWSNRYPTLYKGDAVCGTTTFTCGTNLDGGANVKTRILWKNDDTRNDAAYATKKEVSDSIDALSGSKLLSLKDDLAELVDSPVHYNSLTQMLAGNVEFIEGLEEAFSFIKNSGAMGDTEYTRFMTLLKDYKIAMCASGSAGGLLSFEAFVKGVNIGTLNQLNFYGGGYKLLISQGKGEYIVALSAED